MKRLLSLGLTLFLTLTGAAVEADTELQQPWIDRAYVNDNDAFKSLLVIGVPDHPDERRKLEDRLTKALAKSGVQATASLDVMSADTEVNKESVLAALEGSNIDGVLLTRVFRVDDIVEVQGADSETMRRQHDFATKLWDNYDGMRGQAANLQKNKKQRLVLENNLYELKSEKLVWTVQSYSMNPKSSDKIIKSLSKLASDQLRKDNLI
jgi:hypothetical protein